MFLLELADSGHKDAQAKRFSHVASLDSDWAYDTVPRRHLVGFLVAAGVRVYLVRFGFAWGRVRCAMLVRTGQSHRVCLRVGAISPLLWLLHFDVILLRFAA